MTIQQTATALLRRPAERERAAAGVVPPPAPPAPPAPLRFLFLGNGLDHGWGPRSARPAPTVHLARAVQAITGAPCTVDPVPAGMTTSAAALGLWSGPTTSYSIDPRQVRYDGAVVAVGAHHAMRLTPVAEWGARLVDLVTAVQASLPAGAPVLLVGAPTVHVPKRVRPLNPIAVRHAARLDRVARRFADLRPGVRYLPSPCLTTLVGRRPGGEVAATYTLPIAAALAAAMRPAARTAPTPGTTAPRPADLPALQDIARRAAAEFSVTEAAITLFDGPARRRIADAAPQQLDATELQLYCEAVLTTDEALVVPDGRHDDRFSAEPFLDAAPLPFYAGVPVHGPDGAAVGVLCIRDRHPGTDRSLDLDRLREFAHEAELALRAAAA